MASAILPSRNQPSWSDYSSKFTNSNLNFTRLENVATPNRNPNRNPNPNPNPSHFFISDSGRDVNWKNHEQLLPSSAPPEAAFTGSSVNSVPANSYGHRYITFRLGSYTRRELKELKKRLMYDLERVRILRHSICSTPVPKKNYHHPPAPEIQTAPEVALTVGQKRTKPLPAIRDTKKQCGRVKNNAQRSKVMMRKCGQILVKLMKHKHGWVFNTPVDATALNLYDYHSIITSPMDLGTIKSKLGINEYESPLAFASDVRLTFQNAMVYNGKGSDVFVMAERLLSLFEGMFNPTHHKLAGNQMKKQNRPPKAPISAGKPISNPDVVIPAANSGKPMAMDDKKPVMTVEDKSNLAASLLNLQLGPEGMDEIMSIVKKRVLDLEHEGDEIELDLGVLDNDTLWELHSFINSSGKKAAEGMVTNLVSTLQAKNSPAGEPLAEEGRKREGGEEDIDIGEDIPVSNFPSVEIEKDASSSSSSDSDSSSSDSGSDSSSGDES